MAAVDTTPTGMSATTSTDGDLALRGVLDREAIRAVRARFAHALDTRDWERFAALFADEVDLDLSALGIPAGPTARGEAVALFQHAFRRPASENPTQQLYGSILVEVDGNTATCTSYLVGYHRLPGCEGGDEVTLRVRYDDRLIRAVDGWRIAGTTLHLIALTGNPGILA